MCSKRVRNVQNMNVCNTKIIRGIATGVWERIFRGHIKNARKFYLTYKTELAKQCLAFLKEINPLS